MLSRISKHATRRNLPTAIRQVASNNSRIFRSFSESRDYEVSAMSTVNETGQGDFESKSQQSPLASQRAKEEAAADGEKRSRFSGIFPLGYKASFTQWWANVTPAVAEHNVMSFIPYLQSPPTQSSSQTSLQKPGADGSVEPSISDRLEKTASANASSHNDPYGPRTWHSNLVSLSGKNRALNEFSVERQGEEVENTLVVLHGYGAGLGFFYKNIEALSRPKGWRLYALDLLGMGRSTRPPFKINAKSREESITEAEDWFVDSLEEWRKVRKLERFTLMGHSLGGYMAVSYALKYPGRLNKLILVSPVGIPEDPYAVSAELPTPPDSTLASEFTQDQEATVKAGDNNNFMNARSKAEAAAAKEGKPEGEPARRPLPKWLTYLWDANISPFSLVRWGGPLGPRFVSGWTSRRFSHLPPEESQALHTYAFSLFKQRGSGEYALAYILAPGAFARSPLIRRIGGVGRQMVPTEGSEPSMAPQLAGRRETGIPVVLIYGSEDWMDVKGGFAAKDKLNEARQKALNEANDEEKRREAGSAKVAVVPRAGHHVYLDNFEDFNKVILQEMEDTRAMESRRQR